MSFSAKKSLGQNFLNDENLLNKITDLGNISNEDVILEVGPGTGKLTERILNKNPKDLIVIEKDVRLVEFLKKKFGDKIKVINEDMMKFPYKNFYNKRL